MSTTCPLHGKQTYSGASVHRNYVVQGYERGEMPVFIESIETDRNVRPTSET
jgi:hypothetical protein